MITIGAAVQAFAAWPHLRMDLEEIRVRETLIAALSVGWYFDIIATLAFGSIVLWAGATLWKGQHFSLAVLWIIAVAQTVFGVEAFFLYGRSVHLLGYALTGVLVAIGAVPQKTTAS
ncbi:MAG: hypothetical protein ACHQ50_15940 [Fimbriimonadales bacterium]